MTFYRCAAIGVLPGGDEFQFGLHLQHIGGSVADALTAWTAGVDLLWNGDGGTVAGVTLHYGSGTEILSLVVTSLDALTGRNVAQAASDASYSGTGTGQPLPASTAVCVTTRTGVPTRAGRGRYYLPAPLVTSLASGRFSTGFTGDFADASQAMLDSLVSSTYVPVLFHRSSLAGTNITSTDVGDIPDVQNRRRNKVAERRTSMPVS